MTTTSSDPATERQLKYLSRLLNGRTCPADFAEPYRDRIAAGTLTKRDASDAIGQLLERRTPVPYPTPDETPDIPAGNYAVETKGKLKFYRVDKPITGTWAGWTFLTSQRVNNTEHSIKCGAKNAILRIIARDPETAHARYDAEIGAHRQPSRRPRIG